MNSLHPPMPFPRDVVQVAEALETVVWPASGRSNLPQCLLVAILILLLLLVTFVLVKLGGAISGSGYWDD